MSQIRLGLTTLLPGSEAVVQYFKGLKSWQESRVGQRCHFFFHVFHVAMRARE